MRPPLMASTTRAKQMRPAAAVTGTPSDEEIEGECREPEGVGDGGREDEAGGQLDRHGRGAGARLPHAPVSPSRPGLLD